MLKNSLNQYGSLAKFLHWLLFILILALLIVGYLMDDIQDKSIRPLVFNLHKLTGIAVLFLMLFRLFWASINVKPALSQDTPWWQVTTQHSVYRLMYLTLILMPLSGWIMSVSAGHNPHIFNYQLSLPGVFQNKELSETMFLVHSWLAYIIIALITIHVLAALYHYLIKKDDILERMW